jgi:prophage tail gpP-like protein
MPELYTRDDAKIGVIVNGKRLEGWLQSEVSRSIESLAGTFSVPVSYDPNDPAPIARQDEVSVVIGSTAVIKGIVLSAEPFYRRDMCGLRIIGRDRAGDLIRCCALHQAGQWRNVGLDRICKDLLAPFGIPLDVAADIGPKITDFKVGHGETVLDVISRAARLQGLLAVRSDRGGIVLTKAGKTRFEGVIKRGYNVISMEGIGSDEQRFSEYRVYGQSSPLADFDQARGLKAVARDSGIARYLPCIIGAEGNVTQAELQRLVEHTMRVRRGHAWGFRYVVEGWTFKGKPWPINQRVLIDDPVAGLNGVEWLICSAKATVDLQEGDVTELIVRPVEAYDSVPLRSKIKRHHVRDIPRGRGSQEMQMDSSVFQEVK